MKNATEVIVTGDSAGGLATLNWINYIRDFLPSNIFVIRFFYINWLIRFMASQTQGIFWIIRIHKLGCMHSVKDFKTLCNFLIRKK